ncbi:MAG: hypothetical protein UX04_C0001G0098 [Microgenomates group bacterium GW2011_GWF2_45_18]|nr:MAG: hypothetical protein UW18_C0003G0132 [Microgenomates group bacterium GW2011_GWF1_44_10]KKU02327.1 MAG: hypothetical protein UX04_C0001G0098 [Microgenomates group bacterium GW2011_GWF2_45_18]OGJ41662.1 MAG: hypothetical protein A2378_02135 [Candidatus Pacebacteria bacterium RIFOXYB1_FULL_44_10]HAU99207.1 hypothetical protein [Candidatus Paceibacterota bacterium]
MRRRFLFIGCVLWSFFLYMNTFSNEFVFDDRIHVLSRENIRTLTPQTAVEYFSTPYVYQNPVAGAYRPIVVLSFAMNWAVSGDNAWSYRIVNIFLHALVGFLIGEIVYVISHSSKRSWIVAFLFLVHPLATEVVNSVVNRSESLGMLFSLFAILITLNWRQNWKSELLVFFSAMFAVFSKESSIALIIPVFLLAKNKVVRGGMLILFLIAYFSIRFLVLGSHMVGTDATVAEDVLAHVSTSERVRTAFSIIPVAVGKIVFPAHLSADYSFRQIEVVQTWSWLMVGGIGIFLVVGALAVWIFFKHGKMFPFFLAGCAQYMITSNLFFAIGTIFGERLLYGVIAYLLLFGFGFFSISNEWIRRGVVALLSIWMLGSWFRVWIRNADWKNEFIFFTQMVRDAPNSVLANSNAGAMYLLSGELELADKYITIAESIYPKYIHISNNRGLYYEILGDTKKAEEKFRETLQLNPSYETAQRNLERVQKINQGL